MEDIVAKLKAAEDFNRRAVALATKSRQATIVAHTALKERIVSSYGLPRAGWVVTDYDSAKLCIRHSLPYSDEAFTGLRTILEAVKMGTSPRNKIELELMVHLWVQDDTVSLEFDSIATATAFAAKHGLKINAASLKTHMCAIEDQLIDVHKLIATAE